jgi:O-antigen/teichoic acid export membrane protein
MLRSVLVLGGANYGAMGLSLLISVILTRRLGAEAFGHLALLLMASQLFVLVVANWTQTGLVRFGAPEFTRTGSTSDTFWARMWLVAPLGLVAALAALAFRDPLVQYLAIPRWGLWLLFLHGGMLLANATFAGLFQAREQVRLYSISLLLEKAVLVTAVVLVPAAWVAQALTVLWIYIGSAAVAALWSVWMLGPRSLGRVHLDGRACREMFAYSLPLILSSWAGMFGTNWLNLIVIKQYRPVADVGAYSLATQLAGVVWQVAIVVSTVWLPRVSVMIAQGEEEQVRIISRRVVPYWVMGSSLLFCAVVLGIQPVVQIAFDPAFESAIPAVVILMGAGSALALFTAFSPIVSAYGSTWALTAVVFASAAVNLVMDFALIPAFGINGAAMATLLAYATSAGLVLWLAERRMRSRVVVLSALTAPVVLVCLAFFWVSGAWFYVVAIAAAALSVLALSRAFQLFRGAASGELGLAGIPALDTATAAPLRLFRGWL